MGTQPNRRAPPDRLHSAETHIQPIERTHAQKCAKFPAANCLATGTKPLTWQAAYLRTWAQTKPQTAILSAAAGNGARWTAAAFAALLLTSTRTPGRRTALILVVSQFEIRKSKWGSAARRHSKATFRRG